ncbi:MAG: Gfo/Idh/MocA family oxidoreductase [Verrucomicrobia bacterium]|nr:Gfo/Idh/MocA family oxidoreductase [Verrucomicrobiota bacterium]
MPQQLRWGVMSTAGIGRMQVIPAIQGSTWGRVEVLASRDIEKARSVARELGIKRVTGSYQALLEDPDVDAVYIPLPNTLHADWTIRAAAVGKAVLCEKPLATSAADAARQIEACARHGVNLMEAFMYRFHPQTRRVQELIGSGVIGQVREVRAHLSVNIMRALDAGNIRYDARLGGGALLDMGCYSVSIARMAFGSEPRRVVGRMQIDAKMGVDTSSAGLLEFATGVALISGSFATDGGDIYTIVGTDGYIEVPRGIIPGYGTRAAEGLVIIVDPDGNRHEERIAPANQYRLMADAFAESVLNRRPVPLPPEDGLNNIKVLDALARSSANNAPEPV